MTIAIFRLAIFPWFATAVCALALIAASAAQATPLTIDFTASIGSTNNRDLGNVFNEGPDADLTGQVLAGSITIDPSALANPCGADAACYHDFSAGAVSISFALNGITSTVISDGMEGMFGIRAPGTVSIHDSSHGGVNYVAAAVTGSDGMTQQSIGALFDSATLFSALADGDPSAAIASLANIGDGGGLVKGGVTFLSPVEHLDATILSIGVRRLALAGPSTDFSVKVPEPASIAVFGLALGALRMVRRKRAA